MKLKYVSPEIDICKFAIEDIITTSSVVEDETLVTDDAIVDVDDDGSMGDRVIDIG